MKLFYLCIILFISSLTLAQCPANLNGNAQSNTMITVYIYNLNFEVIGSIQCNSPGNSGNLNCDLTNGVYYSVGDCLYNSGGILIGGLPIELLSFVGHNKDEENTLEWETASENNNDFFTLERSEDGVNWQVISITNGAGNSTENIKYNYIDVGYNNVLNYYKLSQTDYDGQSETFNTIIIDNKIVKKEIQKVVNTLGQEVNENTKGIVFIIYLDGEVERRVSFQ